MCTPYLDTLSCKLYAHSEKAVFTNEVALNPDISVVLPIFKANPIQLVEALDSIADQSFENFECLCIYDAPDNETTRVLRDFEKKDSRFRVVNGNNNGIIDALNLGLKIASGKYIARMDSDDICMPRRFEMQFNFLESENFDIVGGHYFIINESGKYLSARVVPTKKEAIFVTLGLTVPFAHSSVMIRNSFLKNTELHYGLGECRVAEDYQLWMQMFSKGGRFGNIDEWVLKYRWSEKSLSQRVIGGNRRDTFKLQDKYYIENTKLLIESCEKLIDVKNSDEVEEALVFIWWKLFIKKGRIRYLMNIKEKSRRTIAQGTLKFLFQKI